MASLGAKNTYLPKCRICGGTITLFEWRVHGALCRSCKSLKEKLS
ncbi:MAG: hypothetical protein ACFFCM_03590 [Promethearchaeota archaeon]